MLDLKEVGKILDRKTVYPVVKRMLDKDLVYVEEELKEMYKPKIEKYITLEDGLDSEEELKMAFEKLGRSHKQEEVLMTFLKLSGYGESFEPVLKKTLLEETGASHSVLNGLFEKSILKEVHEEVGRFKIKDTDTQEERDLSPAQQKAFDEVKTSFEEKDVCLLHG